MVEDMVGIVARSAVASAEATEALASVAQISAAVCLRGGKPYVPCSACAGACPVGAIQFRGRSAAIFENCLGCGACSVACPTGAIDVAGFDVPPVVGERIDIECTRVPGRFLGPDTWVVPCVAGLGISDLAAAVEKQGKVDASVAFVDRGLCNGCPIACGDNKMASAFSKLWNIVERTKSNAIRLQRIEIPIPASEALAPGLRPPSSRRAFLRSFIAPAPRTNRLTGIRQERAAIARLAASANLALDASFYPAIAVSQDCHDHGVCTASCPTGALRREVSGVSEEIHRLLFDPTRCVACGRCAETCPGQALSFAAAGAPQMQCKPAVLHETRLSVCPKCDEAFVADDVANDLCPACRKNHSLFADLFSVNRRPAAISQSEITGGTV